MHILSYLFSKEMSNITYLNKYHIGAIHMSTFLTCFLIDMLDFFFTTLLCIRAFLDFPDSILLLYYFANPLFDPHQCLKLLPLLVFSLW